LSADISSSWTVLLAVHDEADGLGVELLEDLRQFLNVRVDLTIDLVKTCSTFVLPP
jgi:hypothetical protein